MGAPPASQRRESQLFIGGKWVDASGGTYDVINPATEEPVGQAPEATVADADAAATAAREAGPAWAALPPAERRQLMAAAAQAIRSRAEDLLPLVIAETGATAAVGSRLQVPIAADRFERYSRDPEAVVRRSLPPQVAQATPLAPGGSSAPWWCDSRWAWWPASRRSISRWPTWRARSPPRSPWATPWW